jgi:hypothetical protein
MTNQKELSQAELNYIKAEQLLQEVAQKSVDHGTAIIESGELPTGYDFIGLLLMSMFHCFYHLLKAIYLNTAEINERGKSN